MLNEIAKLAYETARDKGFWDKDRNIGEQLMLVVTELSEALEAHRKSDDFTGGIDNNTKQKIYNNPVLFAEYKDCFPAEIAGAFIRLFDFCGGHKIDIEFWIIAAMEYNKTRGYKHSKNY